MSNEGVFRDRALHEHRRPSSPSSHLLRRRVVREHRDSTRLHLSTTLRGRPGRSPTARSFLTRPSAGTPKRASNPGEGLPIFHACPKGSRRTVLHGARRTSTFLSCAFCEQEGWSGGSPPPSRTGDAIPALLSAFSGMFVFHSDTSRHAAPLSSRSPRSHGGTHLIVNHF